MSNIVNQPVQLPIDMNVDYNVIRYDGSNTQRIKDFNGMYFQDSVPSRLHR